MFEIVLVIHLLLTLALTGVIMIQRSEGGGLGIGGGGGSGGGMGGILSARGTANLLTRTTAIMATLFMVTSILLALIAKGGNKPLAISEQLENATVSAPASTPAPEKETGPQVPLAE